MSDGLAYDAFTQSQSKSSQDNGYDQAAHVAPPSYLPGVTRLSREQAERIYRGSART